MKNLTKFVAMLLLTVILAAACTAPAAKEETKEEVVEAPVSYISYPDDVMTVIENKCMSCHNPSSKNEEAKEHLLWEDLPTMKKIYLSKMVYEIQEVLEDGEMPPEKYLAKKPEKKLTEEETELLMAWTNESLKAMGY